eukprot:1426428-Pyramimonas_sp.AAC.1
MAPRRTSKRAGNAVCDFRFSPSSQSNSPAPGASRHHMGLVRFMDMVFASYFLSVLWPLESTVPTVTLAEGGYL